MHQYIHWNQKMVGDLLGGKDNQNMQIDARSWSCNLPSAVGGTSGEIRLVGSDLD